MKTLIIFYSKDKKEILRRESYVVPRVGYKVKFGIDSNLMHHELDKEYIVTEQCYDYTDKEVVADIYVDYPK